MRLRVTILLISLFFGTLLVSGGYGYWEKSLTIKGDITLVSPETLLSPPVGLVMPANSNIEPADDFIEEPGNQSDNQSILPAPDASGGVGTPVSVETDTKEPEKSEEQESKSADNADEPAPIEQGEESDLSEQSDLHEETEQIVPTDQGDPSENGINEQSASDDSESRESVDSSQSKAEDESLSQDNVEDEM